MKITLCYWCNRIYLKRPFLCECKSNCFLKDVEITQEELKKLEKEEEGAIILGYITGEGRMVMTGKEA